MTNGDGNLNSQKICPFFNGDCIQDKCALWTQVQMGVPSPLGIMGKSVGTCAFAALLMILSTPRPAPQSIPFNLHGGGHP